MDSTQCTSDFKDLAVACTPVIQKRLQGKDLGGIGMDAVFESKSVLYRKVTPINHAWNGYSFALYHSICTLSVSCLFRPAFTELRSSLCHGTCRLWSMTWTTITTSQKKPAK